MGERTQKEVKVKEYRAYLSVTGEARKPCFTRTILFKRSNSRQAATAFFNQWLQEINSEHKRKRTSLQQSVRFIRAYNPRRRRSIASLR